MHRPACTSSDCRCGMLVFYISVFSFLMRTDARSRVGWDGKGKKEASVICLWLWCFSRFSGLSCLALWFWVFWVILCHCSFSWIVQSHVFWFFSHVIWNSISFSKSLGEAIRPSMVYLKYHEYPCRLVGTMNYPESQLGPLLQDWPSASARIIASIAGKSCCACVSKLNCCNAPVPATAFSAARAASCEDLQLLVAMGNEH